MPDIPASRTARPLLAVAAALVAGGVAVALVRPGDLGDDVEDAQAPTTTTTGAPTTPTTGAVTVTTAAAGQVTSSTTATTTAVVSTTATTATTQATTTTAPGSGLGANGTSRADDASADTGMDSMLAPGLALGAGAAVLRRAGRRRS